MAKNDKALVINYTKAYSSFDDDGHGTAVTTATADLLYTSSLSLSLNDNAT